MESKPQNPEFRIPDLVQTISKDLSTQSKSGKMKDMQEKESVKVVRKNLSLWITIISPSCARLKADPWDKLSNCPTLMTDSNILSLY